MEGSAEEGMFVPSSCSSKDDYMVSRLGMVLSIKFTICPPSPFSNLPCSRHRFSVIPDSHEPGPWTVFSLSGITTSPTQDEGISVSGLRPGGHRSGGALEHPGSG